MGFCGLASVWGRFGRVTLLGTFVLFYCFVWGVWKAGLVLVLGIRRGESCVEEAQDCGVSKENFLENQRIQIIRL